MSYYIIYIYYIIFKSTWSYNNDTMLWEDFVALELSLNPLSSSNLKTINIEMAPKKTTKGKGKAKARESDRSDVEVVSDSIRYLYISSEKKNCNDILVEFGRRDVP